MKNFLYDMNEKACGRSEDYKDKGVKNLSLS